MKNGLYIDRTNLVYVFQKLRLDTNVRGQKIDPWTEYRYYSFHEHKVYHITEKMLDVIKFIPVTDPDAIAAARSALKDVVKKGREEAAQIEALNEALK